MLKENVALRRINGVHGEYFNDGMIKFIITNTSYTSTETIIIVDWNLYSKWLNL